MLRSSTGFLMQEITIFHGKPATVYRINQWFWIFVTFGLAYFYFWFKNLGLKYTLTTQRIIIIQGVFSIKKNYIELFRVDDFELIYPWQMRFLGYGILLVKSSDRSVSDIKIYGIKNIEKLSERLRESVISERQRLGIRIHTEA